LKAFSKVARLPEFEKDLKKLSKRFKTLEDDLRIFIDTQLNLFHKLGIDNGGIFQIPGLHIEDVKHNHTTQGSTKTRQFVAGW